MPEIERLFLYLRQTQFSHSAAIDGIDLTSDETRLIGGQKSHQFGDFFWVARAAKGVNTFDVLAELFGVRHGINEIKIKVGINPARRHGVATDAVFAVIDGHRSG